MNYLENKQILYVDSHLKQNGSHSDFSYILDVEIDNQFDSVVLLDASIPKSAYIVSSSNNEFTLDEGGVPRTITLPVGNYNRASFKAVLLGLLNAGAYNYTISYDNASRSEDNGKYVFTIVETGVDPIFEFGADGPYYQMGFEPNSSNSFVSETLTSVNVSNFRFQSVYFLQSDICQNNNNNILQNIISTQSNDFNYINWVNTIPETYAKDFIRDKANLYNFRLVDEDKKPIDLNGVNITFTLCLFKKNKIDQLIKNYIKHQTMKN